MYREDAKKQRRNLFFATVCIVALVVIDALTGGALRRPVQLLGAMVWRDMSAIGTHISALSYFASKASLIKENQQLKDQLTALQTQITAAQQIAEQNKSLQSAVRLAQTTPGVTAAVTSSFKASPYGTFYIAAGQADGIHGGAHVLSPDGSAIGTVIEVMPHQSLVKQLFAPGESVDAQIGTIPITLRGVGGGNAVGEAPRSAHIDAGSLIFSPADAAHAVGIVGKTEGGATSASVTVYARSLANIETLSYVFVTN